MYNVHNTLKNSHILSTFKLVLAAEYTKGNEIQRCNLSYYKWFQVWYVHPVDGSVMLKRVSVKRL